LLYFSTETPLKIAVFINQLGIGGTEKAACEWARQLSLLPDCKGISVISMNDGPRKKDLEKARIPIQIQSSAAGIAEVLESADVIHSHSPGYPHAGDVLGDALKLAKRKIPVVQTNIFGKLENPREDTWTDFRLFVSWTSCIQAARRSKRKLDLNFFRNQSVASNPVLPLSEAEEAQLKKQALRFRESIELLPDHVLFGRFSRPEPNKWTSVIIPAFLEAYRKNPNVRLLLREPPAQVASDLRLANLASPSESKAKTHPILILTATSDAHELAVSQMACDVILHTSSIGESFGYGIAEPMNLGKPVITNSVPWHDQAQLELVQHGVCGWVANTRSNLNKAIASLATDPSLRTKFGQSGRRRLQNIADPGRSTQRIRQAFSCAMEGKQNPHATEDLAHSILTAKELDDVQWGHGYLEKSGLLAQSAWISFLRWQKNVRDARA
jgi:glycosyltransferase involved in cell wall biosynthesis